MSYAEQSEVTYNTEKKIKELEQENERLKKSLIQLIDYSIDDLLDLKKKIHNDLTKEKSEWVMKVWQIQ